MSPPSAELVRTWVPSRAATATPPRPRPPIPLHESVLLYPVLECVMSDGIERNEREAEAELPPSCAYRGYRYEPSVFHALQAPSVSPSDYLYRLIKHSHCTRSAFIIAFYYLERVAEKGVDLGINSLSVHRLLLTAVLLAIKYLEDVLYDNAHFAIVGGLDVQELNMLELDMLKVLNFRLHISPEEFTEFEQKLLNIVMCNTNPEFAKLRCSLRNLGYCEPKRPPSSPTSILDNLEH